MREASPRRVFDLGSRSNAFSLRHKLVDVNLLAIMDAGRLYPNYPLLFGISLP